MGFFPEHIKMLMGEGHSVEIATNCEQPLPEIYKTLCCKSYDIRFSRSPFDKDNLTAYKQLKALVEKEHYDIVHCHTPNAAMVTRLACRKVRKQGTRVFYTAHGFHFFKGAPLKNWLMYYPVEKFCARYTDVLITINHEDFELAKKKMHVQKVCYVPGVGIDLSKIQNIQCNFCSTLWNRSSRSYFIIFHTVKESKSHNIKYWIRRYLSWRCIFIACKPMLFKSS